MSGSWRRWSEYTRKTEPPMSSSLPTTPCRGECGPRRPNTRATRLIGRSRAEEAGRRSTSSAGPSAVHIRSRAATDPAKRWLPSWAIHPSCPDNKKPRRFFSESHRLKNLVTYRFYGLCRKRVSNWFYYSCSAGEILSSNSLILFAIFSIILKAKEESSWILLKKILLSTTIRRTSPTARTVADRTSS
jgi:hypothetical protein